jgi:UV DNA damage endonuclease
MENKHKLSLCCISKTLSESGHSFRSMTLTQFKKKPFAESLAELSERILHNFKIAARTIRFCQNNNIQGYRLSSSLAPVLTHSSVNLKICDLPNFSSILQICEEIKSVLAASPLRISAHPSEYISLSSSNPECIENSCRDLSQHSEIFDLLGLPQDYNSPMNIHVRQDGDPVEISKRVRAVYESLPDNVRNRLVLENNDNAKGVWSIRNLIKYFPGVPITFDILHHSLLPDGLEERAAFDAARETWPVEPIFHYSEGVDGTRKHADAPKFAPPSYGEVLWDVELKNKCRAIFAIREIAA